MRRIYQELLLRHFRRYRQMAFVSGPRQVGKTTTMMEVGHSWGPFSYYNWDNEEDRALLLEGARSLARASSVEVLSEREPCILLDEIHKFPRWKNFLKGFFDTYEKKTKIAVTGSARLNVYKKGSDSLLGRYFPYRMHPLSVGELVCKELREEEIGRPLQCPEEDWQALLVHGGFPEPFLQRSPTFSQRWRSMRSELLFREDIRDATRVQEIALLELLANLLRLQGARSMDYLSLSRKVQVSVDTVRRWVELLKSFYYCFSIQPWTKNISRSLLKEPKIYLWDWASLDGEGERNENFVASHLLKAVHFWTDRGMGEYELYYLRNKEKMEVDFLVVKDKKPWFLVEVKTKTQGLSPSLFHFQQETKAPHAFQVAFDLPYVEADCFALKDPCLVPARTFLSQLV